MKVNVARSAGFCFGVKRAITIALDAARTYGPGRVCMLGDIVHNEDVVKQVRKAGIIKTGKLTRTTKKVLLLRAHGACMKVQRRARALGYLIVDATCPMVKEIHRIAQEMEKNGRRIIIIGDKKHDEVHGIMGQLRRPALILEDEKGVRANAKLLRSFKKAAVVVQSTQNLEKVFRLRRLLKGYIADLKFFNTVCKPTRIKQEEIKRMPLENDVMLIIGSKSSANTRRLFEISRSLNKRSYRVNSCAQIRPEWFKGCASVGVTAGASTPDTTTQAIVKRLKRLR